MILIFCCSSCSSGHFSWEKYLKETGAIAAPSSCFRQVCKMYSLNILQLSLLSCYYAATLQLTLVYHQHPEPHTSN